MAEAGADPLCPAPRAPRNPATRNRAGDTTAAVSPSPAPRAQGPRPAERGAVEDQIREARKKKKKKVRVCLTSPSSARGTRLGGGALVDGAGCSERQLLTRSVRSAGSSAGGSEARRRCSR